MDQKNNENKIIHIDDLCVEWGKQYTESDLHFSQYVKQKISEGWTVIYSEDATTNE